jgi:hypothetical protein
MPKIEEKGNGNIVVDVSNIHTSGTVCIEL